MAAQQTLGLTTAERRQWDELGYLVFEKVASEELLQELRAAADRLSAVREREGGLERLISIHSAPLLEPAFWKVLHHPKLLAVATGLFGPNVCIHDAKLNWKPPAKGKGELAWHQDFPYFPRTNFDLGAFLLYLDDSTVENGCVRVIPGSHKRGPVNHFRDGQFTGVATDPRDYADAARAIDQVIPAGTLAVHHCCLLHASYPNFSDQSRRALACDLAAADAVLLGGNAHAICGTMLCGEDPLVARLQDGTTFKLPRPITNRGAFKPPSA